MVVAGLLAPLLILYGVSIFDDLPGDRCGLGPEVEDLALRVYNPRLAVGADRDLISPAAFVLPSCTVPLVDTVVGTNRSRPLWENWWCVGKRVVLEIRDECGA